MLTPDTNSPTFSRKGNFTRDEWNNLLHFCNISHFSSVCCSQNFSSASCAKTMAKRMQQGHGEERIVAKSKLAASSSTVLSPNASNRPGILRAPCQKGLILQECTEKPVARDSNQNDAASSSQVWQKDAERDVREYEETRSARGGKLRIH